MYDLDGNLRRLLDVEDEFLVLEIGSLPYPLFRTRRVRRQAKHSVHNQAQSPHFVQLPDPHDKQDNLLKQKASQ